jgi:hypothetical protein
MRMTLTKAGFMETSAMGNRPVTECHGDPIWEFQAFRTAGEATASYRHRGKLTCMGYVVTERGIVRYHDRPDAFVLGSCGA